MKNPTSILITGGSSGIGKPLCLHYAKPGVTISFTGRNEARVNEVADLVREMGADINARVLDVRDTTAMKNWFIDIDNRTPIDLVIANAGSMTRQESNTPPCYLSYHYFI